MLISLKKRIVFLSMPKCASTSIESALFPYSDLILTGHPGIKHINIDGYYRKVKPLVDISGKKNLETFCLFREPLEWLQSWYRYRSRPALADPKKPNHKNYTGNITFQDFIISYISGQNDNFSRVGRQSRFVSFKSGVVGVDRIFKMDDKESLNKFLEKRIGKRIEIPKKNSSPSGVQYQLDKSIKKQAIEFLSDEYEIFESL